MTATATTSVTRWLKCVFNICSFFDNETLPNSIQNLPRKVILFKKLNNPSKIAQKSFNILPKWRSFAQSGHTDVVALHCQLLGNWTLTRKNVTRKRKKQFTIDSFCHRTYLHRLFGQRTLTCFVRGSTFD